MARQKQEQEQDVDALKRRGRRRLVGAVALVLLAVIVLPMVFDPEPRQTLPPVSVTIPGQDEGVFAPKGPKPQAKATERKAEAPPVAEKTAEERRAAPDEKKAEPPKPPAKEASKERSRAEAALANADFIVPVGAFANPDGVIAKLSGAKVPYYTEALSGNLTRVRAGPFPTREAAEKAAARLKGLGLQPGPVGTRSG